MVFGKGYAWGRMTYINYRNMIELGYEEYFEIDVYCKEKGSTGLSPAGMSLPLILWSSSIREYISLLLHR